MKKAIFGLLAIIVLAGLFFAGCTSGNNGAGGNAATGGSGISDTDTAVVSNGINDVDTAINDITGADAIDISGIENDFS